MTVIAFLFVISALLLLLLLVFAPSWSMFAVEFSLSCVRSPMRLPFFFRISSCGLYILMITVSRSLTFPCCISLLFDIPVRRIVHFFPHQETVARLPLPVAGSCDGKCWSSHLGHENPSQNSRWEGVDPVCSLRRHSTPPRLRGRAS